MAGIRSYCIENVAHEKRAVNFVLRLLRPLLLGELPPAQRWSLQGVNPVCVTICEAVWALECLGCNYGFKGSLGDQSLLKATKHQRGLYGYRASHRTDPITVTQETHILNRKALNPSNSTLLRQQNRLPLLP
jgi:hypothetical protein